MELFYSQDISGNIIKLDDSESQHCIRVLRHRTGDCINVIDGCGTLYSCRIIDDSQKGAAAEITESISGWGGHSYHLTMAVSPTKNIDRYEWFIEKACEIGIDRICPVIGEHSERKVFKTERARKLLISAAKQSLKASIPEITEALDVSSFIREASDETLKLIACCFEDSEHPRCSVTEAIRSSGKRDICILIGPEGDFSPNELKLALENGFIPIHLGDSRLRTETAALVSVTAVYLTEEAGQ